MNQVAIYHEKIIINQMRENLPYCHLETQHAKHEIVKLPI